MYNINCQGSFVQSMKVLSQLYLLTLKKKKSRTKTLEYLAKAYYNKVIEFDIDGKSGYFEEVTDWTITITYQCFFFQSQYPEPLNKELT